MRRLLVLLSGLPGDAALTRAAADDGGPVTIATAAEGKELFARIGR